MIGQLMEEEDLYMAVVRRSSILYARVKQLSILLYLNDVKKEGRRTDILEEIKKISKYQDELLNHADFNSDIYQKVESFIEQIDLVTKYLFIHKYKEVNVHLQSAKVLKESLSNSAFSKFEW